MYATMPTKIHRQVLVYGQTVEFIESAAGAGAYLTYRLNSPYDPDTTVGSLGTPGFSNFAQLFNRYRVLRTRVELHGGVECSGFFYGQVTFLPCAFQPVIPSNPQAWPTQRLATTCRANMCSISASGGASFPVNLMKQYSLNDIVDCSRAEFLSDLDYTGLTNGNPTKIVYLAITLNGRSSSVLNFRGYLKISYDIEFLDPFPLAL